MRDLMKQTRSERLHPQATWEGSAKNKLFRIARPDQPGVLQLKDKNTRGARYTHLRQNIDYLIENHLQSTSPGDAPVFVQFWELLAADAFAELQLLDPSWEVPEIAIERIADLLIKKQSDYGTANIARFGRTGLIIRLHDKVARLENLRGSGGARNESIEDTLLDVIGYSVVGLMWEDGTFMVPLLPS